MEDHGHVFESTRLKCDEKKSKARFSELHTSFVSVLPGIQNRNSKMDTQPQRDCYCICLGTCQQNWRSANNPEMNLESSSTETLETIY